MVYAPGSTLLSSEEINGRVKELGNRISEKYAGEEVVVIAVLKGAVIFLSDLVRYISPDVKVILDFMAVSSYGDSTKTSGVVKINKDLDSSVSNRHVLIVEDIVDTGLTLSYLKKIFNERKPLSVSVCALLDKKEKRQVDVKVDFTGFEIPDKFVVGYGLDFAGQWRNLPDILCMEEIDLQENK